MAEVAGGAVAEVRELANGAFELLEHGLRGYAARPVRGAR